MHETSLGVAKKQTLINPDIICLFERCAHLQMKRVHVHAQL